tara:strand:+ start:1014 stop:2000 length:987 start_codon:yes stop_codon:yes gene_type:complete
MTRIAVIGAGIAGLSIAHLLKDHADIELFEKARGVGGRMSTRRAEPYFFDHGAQYFTARTKPFQNFIHPLITEGVIARWDARYVKFKKNKIIASSNWIEEEPRYTGVPGMNHAAKFLAQGLNVHINTKISSLKNEGTWKLIDDKNQQYSGFDWVICTAPAPQSSALFPESFKYYADIKSVEMLACFSLMLGFEHSFPIEFDAAHVTGSDVSWIAVNNNKPKHPGPLTLVIHSSSEYAQEHIDDDREQVMQHLIKETSSILGYNISAACYKNIHGWRYANNTDQNQKKSVFLDLKNKLGACGDWCCGGRIEGAFTSAYELTQKMKENNL